MLVRATLGAMAGGCLGVIGSVFAPEAHAGAAGAVCGLLGAAGALLAVRPAPLRVPGVAGAGVVCCLATVMGTFCSAHVERARASDQDVLMAITERESARLVASGELNTEEKVLVMGGANPREMPAAAVVAAGQAWDRMTLEARASLRAEVGAEKRLRQGYMAGSGPMSVVKPRDAGFAVLGMAVSVSSLGFGMGRRRGVRTVPAVVAGRVSVLKRAA